MPQIIREAPLDAQPLILADRSDEPKDVQPVILDVRAAVRTAESQIVIPFLSEHGGNLKNIEEQFVRSATEFFPTREAIVKYCVHALGPLEYQADCVRGLGDALHSLPQKASAFDIHANEFRDVLDGLFRSCVNLVAIGDRVFDPGNLGVLESLLETVTKIDFGMFAIEVGCTHRERFAKRVLQTTFAALAEQVEKYTSKIDGLAEGCEYRLVDATAVIEIETLRRSDSAIVESAADLAGHIREMAEFNPLTDTGDDGSDEGPSFRFMFQ